MSGSAFGFFLKLIVAKHRHYTFVYGSKLLPILFLSQVPSDAFSFWHKTHISTASFRLHTESRRISPNCRSTSLRTRVLHPSALNSERPVRGFCSICGTNRIVPLICGAERTRHEEQRRVTSKPISQIELCATECWSALLPKRKKKERKINTDCLFGNFKGVLNS